MATTLQFTDDEMAQLHLLVAQDTEKSRIELHHTSGIPYRAYVKERLAKGKALLSRMNDALSPLAVAGGNGAAGTTSKGKRRQEKST